ncbi:MAG: ferrous iron transport protein B [Clostridiales bacterium]|jgi:ferrous iron transport protein B|nr:ferrous iron transport protein B [Clostridiales bacterium]
MTIAFAGNPNCGKTTLFNAYTGASLKVANWPGVTVEKKEGVYTCNGREHTLVDLPGMYSLSTYTIEERVSRQFLLSGAADVVINVADASCLSRSLYLTLELIESGRPVVLALNMMDILKKRGQRLNLERLSQLLGIPVIPVCARRREGISVLMKKALCADAVRQNPAYSFSHIPDQERFAWIESVVDTCLTGCRRAALTDRADAVLLHSLWGTCIFFIIMAAVFLVTFSLGDLAKVPLESGLERLYTAVRQGLDALYTAPWLTSLIVDGILSGVGGILTFLPNIILLFFALSLLEDSGYMARVAYIMDGIMGSLGLSGRAFLPMLLGMGCTVPAVMASRTLETRRDRLRVILITPFMSCSARLPVYILLAGAFFGKYASLAALSMYGIGLLTAALVAWCTKNLGKKEKQAPLILELPDYKAPAPRTVILYVWEKIRDYLTRAGTTIFLASILLWILLHVGPGGFVASMEDSFAAWIGQKIAPLLAPCGLGMWQIAVALIAGIAAKEVVVSSLAVLLGITNISSAAGMGALRTAWAAYGFGPINAYALMVFVLLYIPCAAALATICCESKSRLWTAGAAALQIGAAWIVSTLVYQIGSLFL